MTRTQRFGHFVRGAVFFGAVATLLVATPLASAQNGAGPDGMQIDQSTGTDRTNGGGGVVPKLFYGPIPGFTTAAYAASDTIAAPLGSLIPFHIDGLKRGQSISWNGAESVSSDGLTATCLVNSTGPIFVTATIYPDQVDLVCKLDVIAVTPGGLTFDLAAPIASVLTHKRPTNSELVALYHNPESLAAFVVARDGSASTAVKRTLLAIPDNPKFSVSSGELTTDLLSSLIEWRVDGKAVGVGSNFFETKGVRQIEVGPPGHATVFELTSYDVHLNSPDVVNGVIPTDRPITFTATTDPPGYEKNLRWIAATKYGSSFPSSGSGDTFTTTFSDIFAADTSVNRLGWLGVRVGNVGIGSDPYAPIIVKLIAELLSPPPVPVPVPTEIGSFTARVNPAGNITADVTIDPAFSFLCEWYNFRWVNVEVSYIVDANGDGDFNDPGDGPVDSDGDGNPDDPLVGELPAADAAPLGFGNGDDNLPWYWTNAELGASAWNRPFDDARSDPSAGRLTFKTYLVVENLTDPNIPAGTFCVLAGFEWTSTTPAGGGQGVEAIVGAIAPGAADVALINTAIGRATGPGPDANDPVFPPPAGGGAWTPTTAYVLSACQ